MSHWLYTTFAAIAVAAIISFVFIWYMASLIQTRIEIKTTQAELNKMALLRAVEKCLKFDQEYITASILNDKQKQNICSLCNLCDVKKTWIEDIETGQKWFFDSEGIISASLSTNIEIDNKIHIGVIYVEM
jgi:hypothetical protein